MKRAEVGSGGCSWFEEGTGVSEEEAAVVAGMRERDIDESGSWSSKVGDEV